MSKIDKLSILGVRSFDNQSTMTIQFHTPLTLIVGTNGSGKTTIIECLRYATTGLPPPNTDKGATFIHDAKLCGESEVLAQVKLRLKTIEGTTAVCTRSLQLTVKRNSRSFKTLEGHINFSRSGETSSISSKQTSLDTLMPQLMGVSRAILDGVIFCHQEESLWPLQKSADLKTRFDQIFDAIKYTKAVEAIKLLQKKKKDELQLLKKDEESAKSDNSRAKKARTVMARLEDETEELRSKVEHVSKQYREATQRVEAARNQGRNAGEIVGRLVGKRIEREAKQESVKELREVITEMADSDEDLQHMLEQYEERVLQYREQLKAKTDAYMEIGRHMQQISADRSSKERECGTYEAEKAAHSRHLEIRERLVKESARSHSIHGFNGTLTADQIQEFAKRFTKLAHDQNDRFEQARSKTREDLQRVQVVLNGISEQKSTHEQRKRNCRESIAANERKMASFQTALNKINIDEGGIVRVESQLQDVQTRLQAAKSTSNNLASSNEIQVMEADLRRFEGRRNELDTELGEAMRRAGETARFDYVQKEVQDRRRGLKTMVDAHGERIGSVLGPTWTSQNLETDFRRIEQDASGQVSEAERQRDGANRELEQVDFQLNACRAELQSKTESVSAAAASIREAVDCDPPDYPAEVEKMERSRDYLKADAESSKVMFEYFDACIKAAKEKGACRTCSRGLKGKEIDVLIRTIEREKKKMEGDEDESILKSTEEDLKTARAASSDFDLWERLTSKDIPKLKVDERDLLQKRVKLLKQLEDKDTILDEKKIRKHDVDALDRHIQSITKYHSEIAGFESQIDELKAKQESSGALRGLEAIEQDKKEITVKLQDTSSNLARLRIESDRAKSLVHSLELEIRDIKSKLSAAENELREKKVLEEQILESTKSSQEQRETIRSIDLSLEALSAELAKEQATYDDINRGGAEKEQELQAELNKINTSMTQLNQANREIQDYLDRGGPTSLERVKVEAKQLEHAYEQQELDRGNLVREAKALEDQLRDHDQIKRGIADNQRYRRDLRHLQNVMTEIQELESHNAEDEQQRWNGEAEYFDRQRAEFSTSRDGALGALTTKQQELNRMIDEYNSEYKNAAYKYKESHILVETTKAAIDDLGQYWAALDKAIMKFHEMKMEEINRIIEELWRKTYQGTDVDSIMIRSENEASKGNKSYNYRVVMVKQDVEMDMRGRCSAGQKVLACIIIRLALAECFGVNCGLIALDEPTTNLDRENIRALALSLAEIIRVRRAQRNFQLIVITHDEEFLQMMGCSDFTDYYYRVSRDERQKSVIERQNINEVL